MCGIGSSALGLSGLVSVYYDWVDRLQFTMTEWTGFSLLWLNGLVCEWTGFSLLGLSGLVSVYCDWMDWFQFTVTEWTGFSLLWVDWFQLLWLSEIAGLVDNFDLSVASCQIEYI